MNYVSQIRFLFAHYNTILPQHISQQNIVEYICFLKVEFNSSRAKCHQVSAACSFYYKYVFVNPFIIPTSFYPRKEHKLPRLFSLQQIHSLLSTIKNTKHVMIASLFYGTGLRLNELCNVKLADVDSEKYEIKVVVGKGNKQRFTILPKHLLIPLRNYYKMYKPTTYLFEGCTNGKPMHPRSIQHFIQKNIAKIGLQNQGFSTHTLRHSFATHLLDNGVNIHTIKELLGHSSLSSTMVYLHLQASQRANIISPFDSLQLDF